MRAAPRFVMLLGGLGVGLMHGSCGAERDLTGIWRMTGCGEATDAGCDDGFAYEIHLGRFGDDLAGLVVRYRTQGDGFDSFQKPYECGCAFIESGSVRDERLLIQVGAAGAQLASDECGPAPPPCEDERYTLTEGDNDTLSGQRRCGARASKVGFELSAGRPRRQCGAP